MADLLRAGSCRRWAGLLALAFALLGGATQAQAQAPDAAPPKPVRLVGFVNVPKPQVELNPAERSWLKERHTLRAGVVPNDFVPFDLIGLNGDYEGISADYLSVVSSALGLEVQLKVFANRAEASRALRAGEIDILPTTAGWMASREAALSSPYSAIRHVEATSRDRRVNRASRITVGYMAGHVTPEALRQTYPDAKFVSYATAFLGVAALTGNKIDAFVELGTTVGYLIDHFQLSNLRLSDFGDGAPDAMHFAFRPDDEQLRRLVDRALASLPQRVRSDVKGRWSPTYESTELLARVQFTDAERKWMAANPVVRYAPLADFMPFMFRDHLGRNAGLSLQVMDKVASETGLVFEPVAGGADALAQADLIPAVMRGQALPPGLQVSDPYFRDHWVIVGRIGDPELPSVSALSGKRLAFFSPNTVAEMLREKAPDIGLVPTDSVASTYELVASGRADVTIGNIDTVNYIVQQFYPARLKVAGSIDDAPVDIAFAVQARAPELLSILNKSIESIPEEELRRVRANGMFFSRPGTDWSSYVRWLYLFGAGLLVCLALFAVWTRSLRKEVGRRHAVEGELRDQLSFQRAMLEGIPHAIGVRDAQGRLTSCNAAFEALFKVPRGAVLGKTLPEVEIAGEERNGPQLESIHARYMRLILDGTPINEDVDVMLGGVAKRILHWAAPISLKAHGRRVAFVTGAIDLTERHQLVELLEAARAKAEAANRAKSNFLATMSHEIRTPMNAVMGILELLVREGRLNPQDRDSAELARSSARGLLGLIDDILDISKIEAGGLEVVPRPAQLRPLIHEVANVFESLARQRGLRIDVQIDDAVASWHAVDAPRFRQIVNNLVSNAIKYSDRGGVTIRLAQLGRSDEVESLELEVRDTGIGIAPEDVQNLFKPFFQAEAAGPRTLGGTGLGLPIVQRLCMKMGGDISVTSERGVGTSIHVALRLLVLPPPEAEAPDAAQETEPVMHEAARQRFNILVVDDHPANRLLLQRQLGFLGFRSETAEDGRVALDMWQGGRFDAVITDCSMPVMDGYALTDALRAIERENGMPRCPVLGCTAHVQEHERRRALDVGMDECLMKPVSVDGLLEALARHLPGDAAPAPVRPPAAQAGDDAAAATFDLHSLKDFSGGDARIEASFLEALLRTNLSDLEELEALVKTGAARELASGAHKIKGAARIVKADAVVRDCETLEEASHGTDADAVARAFEALKTSLGAFNDAMARQLQVFASLAH